MFEALALYLGLTTSKEFQQLDLNVEPLNLLLLTAKTVYHEEQYHCVPDRVQMLCVQRNKDAGSLISFLPEVTPFMMSLISQQVQ